MLLGLSEHMLWIPSILIVAYDNFVDAHWLDWFELDNYCVCVLGIGRSLFKSRGVKKNSVPICGIAESFKNICGKYGIHPYFKGNTTIKQILMKPKDQDPKDRKSGAIYSYQCGDIACSEEYIGETLGTLGERYWEHLKQPSPIHVHLQQTGHTTTNNNFNIIGREDQGLARTIKESICIRVNNPMLNRNIGKYNLNHIWDRVIFNTPGLKIGSSQYLSHIHNNGHAQTNLTNGHPQIIIGHSEHAWNSEHVLRES